MEQEIDITTTAIILAALSSAFASAISVRLRDNGKREKEENTAEKEGIE